MGQWIAHQNSATPRPPRGRGARSALSRAGTAESPADAPARQCASPFVHIADKPEQAVDDWRGGRMRAAPGCRREAYRSLTVRQLVGWRTASQW